MLMATSKSSLLNSRGEHQPFPYELSKEVVEDIISARACDLEATPKRKIKNSLEANRRMLPTLPNFKKIVALALLKAILSTNPH